MRIIQKSYAHQDVESLMNDIRDLHSTYDYQNVFVGYINIDYVTTIEFHIKSPNVYD